MSVVSVGRRARYCAIVLGVLVASPGCDIRATSEPGAGRRSVETATLFANAAVSATTVVRSDLEFAQFALWPQHFAGIGTIGADRYELDEGSIDASWRALYAGPLEDIDRALRQARAADNPREIGPLLVLRAWTYYYITGIWGDVPFTAANAGTDGTLRPAYDRQAAIYEVLLKNLADAAQLMDAPNTTSFGTGDPIYGGDAARWKRFAQSLRARLGLSLTRIDPARARSEVEAAIAAGGFATPDDDAEIRWPGDGSADNPWARHERAHDDLRLSKTLADTLINLSDPRLPVYGRAATLSGQLAGAPNGLPAAEAATFADIASPPGVEVVRPDAPSSLMTYEEFAFIEAEAAERGWIAGSAKQFYEEGIRVSLRRSGVAATDVDAYLATSRVQYAGGEAGLRQIALQKWIALFTEGVDAWFEWRRTGYPELVPAAAAATSPAAIPRRLPYPISERALNGVNLQAAIDIQGGATLTHRLWVDP